MAISTAPSHRKIPQTFTQKGWTLTQKYRQGDIGLFERCWEDGKAVHFEVIIIKRHNGYTIQGVTIDPAEIYPSSTMWGTYGWTYKDEGLAWEKFRSLIREQ